MRTLFATCLAATALVAQSTPVIDEPHLAGVLEPAAAAQLLLPVQGFPASMLAYSPVPYPALRAGDSVLYVPDPLLCSANYAGADVAQLVCAVPQGVIVLLDASSSLALHVMAVPAGTWSMPTGICIDGAREQVVLLDSAQPSLLRIALADLRAGNAQFTWTALPSAWSAVRGIAFDSERDRVVGLDPTTGDLLQHTASEPSLVAGSLRPLATVFSFGFAPAVNPSTGSVDVDLFITSGDERMLTDRWTWNAVTTDDETATLRATVLTSSWVPPSPDPSGIAYDALNDRLVISDNEVDEMTIYAGKNVFETSRTGVLSRTTTTVGYSNEPTGVTLDAATRTFYITNDDADEIDVVSTGPDGLLHTADDTVRPFSVRNFCPDAESLAFDSATGTLWIAGGLSNLLHKLRPGLNGYFDGTPPNGDDVLASFDLAQYGVTNAGGVALRSGDGGIYVLGIPKTRVIHLNALGQLIRVINLPSTSMVRPQSIVFAPSTVGGGDSLFLVDRGHDNDVDPLENDGRMREYAMPAPVQINQPPVVNAGPDVNTTTTSPAHLAGSVGDDGLSGPLTKQWSQLAGPGTAFFTAPTQPVTDVSFSAAGNYTLQLSSSDGEFSSSDTVDVSVQEPPPGTILEVAVAASWDDAEEQPTTTVRSSADLDMVVDGTINQVIGLRFLNLAIPPGATIASAYVQFTTDSANSSATQLTLAGQASDNPPTFLTNIGNISTRPRTTATVPWAPVAWSVVGEAGPNQRTPELASIVQEITNRPGWLSGNALVLVITGTGCRNASTWDRAATLAPKLVVRYLTSAPINQPPAVNAGPDVTAVITTAAQLSGTVTDDGLPGPLTIQWSKLSGPGTVTFTGPNQAVTNVTFSALGTYTCQLSAFDGEFTRTDTVVVTVQASNQAPAVNAGPDVATAITSSAHLAGTASDDGLAAPLSIQWSMLSGPGTATFTAPAQAVSDVSFSAVGSYTLQLSAFDGEFTSTDTVVVTVTPANQAPVVNAGPDLSTVMPAAAHLVGTVSDDGMLSPLTIQWRKVSGPGTATFTAPAQPVTDVSFSLAGSYTLELSAFDGGFTSTDTVVVTAQQSAGVTFERAISSGNDDAEERGNKIDRGSDTLEMVVDGTVNQVVGLRFTNVVIPKGAVITSAYLQFTTEKATSIPTQLSIVGEASNNASSFRTSALNISSRPDTAASVGWAPAPWTVIGQAGLDQRTPDLASIVQEITNRAGWATGNAMVFTISGTGCRTATSYNQRRAAAPKLVVTYHM